MRRSLLATIGVLAVFAAIAIAWIGGVPRSFVAGKIDTTTVPLHDNAVNSGKKPPADSATAQTETQVARHQVPAVPDLTYLSLSPTSKPRPFDISIAQFAKDYDSLARAAEAGNADAARKIVDALSNCHDVPMDQADLAGRLAENARDALPDDASIRDSARFLTEQYQRCSALSPERRSSYKYWLRISAELGDAEARLRYVSGGFPEGRSGAKYWADLKQYREIASAYLDAEIATGNPRALLAASQQYGSEEDRYKLYQHDKIKGYAYRYAYLLATGANEGSDFFVDSLVLSQQGMSADDISKATALGKQIYDGCCSQ